MIKATKKPPYAPKGKSKPGAVKPAVSAAKPQSNTERPGTKYLQERNRQQQLLRERRALNEQNALLALRAESPRSDIVAQLRSDLVKAGLNRNKSGKRTEAMEQLVLGWLRKGYTRKVAAEKCNLTVSTIEAWRIGPRPKWRPEGTPSFAEDYHAAMAEGTDVLEEEALRRGLDGYDEPVYQGGALVGHVRKYSDHLLLNTLRARRPEYRATAPVEQPAGQQVTTINIVGVPPGHFVTADQLKLQSGSIDGSIVVPALPSQAPSKKDVS